MRCSNCSAPLPDGAPSCHQCGTEVPEESAGPRRARSGTDPGQPALGAPTVEQEAASLPDAAANPTRKAALRAKLGAPKPAEFAPDEGAATAIGQAVTSAPTKLRAAVSADPAPPTQLRNKVSLDEPDSPSQSRRPRAPAGNTARPGIKREVSRPVRAAAPTRRRAESTDTDSETDPGDEAELPAAKPRAKPSSPPMRAGQPLVQPGKYASIAREPEMTMARPELQHMEAAAPPPLNPEEMLQSMLATVKQMPFEDKLESFAAAAMVLMTFMPWRQVRGEGDLGLITSAGFFSLLLAAGVLALMYLRFTGRVPTLPATLLSKVEAGVVALQLPITLIFIVTSIDRHETHYGSLTTYASMPDFGAVLSLLANFVALAGAALVVAREARAAR